MEKESRSQRGTMLGNARGEDSPAKGHSSVRASAISARRSYQPGVIGLEK